MEITCLFRNSFIKDFHLLLLLILKYEIEYDLTSLVNVYLENRCIIVSVALGIFSGRLTEKSRQDFRFGFWLFPS